jgi:hypothetical protein
VGNTETASPLVSLFLRIFAEPRRHASFATEGREKMLKTVYGELFL